MANYGVQSVSGVERHSTQARWANGDSGDEETLPERCLPEKERTTEPSRRGLPTVVSRPAFVYRRLRQNTAAVTALTPVMPLSLPTLRRQGRVRSSTVRCSRRASPIAVSVLSRGRGHLAAPFEPATTDSTTDPGTPATTVVENSRCGYGPASGMTAGRKSTRRSLVFPRSSVRCVGPPRRLHASKIDGALSTSTPPQRFGKWPGPDGRCRVTRRTVRTRE